MLNPPSGVSANVISATTVVLTWKAPKTSIDVEDYTISYTQEGTRDTAIRKVGSPSTTFSLDGLTPKTKYIIKIKTVGGGHSSKYSFAVEAETPKVSKAEKKKGKSKQEEKASDAPPAVPELVIDKKAQALMETVKCLEQLQIFFGVQQVFLKEIGGVMNKNNKTYGGNVTVTGKTGQGRNSQKKSFGGSDLFQLSNKRVEEMHAMYLSEL